MGNVKATVPNQKVIIINKALADKDHKYSIINLEAFDYALTKLNTIGSFKLWCYLAKNQNKYEFALSQVATCRDINISKGTYLSAVTALEDKGFLVPVSESSNKYIFYELPTTATDPMTKDDKTIQIPEEKIKAIKEFNF